MPRVVIPHLKLLHKYPFITTFSRTNLYTTPFILNGANVMAPGYCTTESAMEEFKAG